MSKNEKLGDEKRKKNTNFCKKKKRKLKLRFQPPRKELSSSVATVAVENPTPVAVEVGATVTEDDPDMAFGRMIANELKMIRDEKRRQFAKLQIHSILFNAQFGLTCMPNDTMTSLTLKNGTRSKCIADLDDDSLTE